MGTKYATVAIVGYNASPPADDGSVVDSNKIKWSYPKTKLGDPLVAQVAAIDTALLTALNTSAVQKSANYTTTAAENERIIECTGTFTLLLGDAATMTTQYSVRVVNNGVGTITIGLATGANTLNGTAAGTRSLLPLQSERYSVNASANGYYVMSNSWNLTLNGDTTIAGSLAITGTGRRFTADFSNATLTNRLLFQSSTVNGLTDVQVIPNGSSTTSAVVVGNSSNPALGQYVEMRVYNVSAKVSWGDVTGAANTIPLIIECPVTAGGLGETARFFVNGNVTLAGDTGTRAMQLTYTAGSTRCVTVVGSVAGNPKIGANSDNLVIGTGAAIATGATAGYMMIPSCAGTPTGVPAGNGAGQIALHYDTTANKLWAYNGAWRSTAALT